MRRLLLVTPSAAFEEWVRNAVSLPSDQIVKLWRDDLTDLRADEAARIVADEGIDVVAIGPSVDVTAALQLAEAIDADHPEIVQVLVAKPAGDLWQRVLRAGVREVIAPDASGVEIGETMARALDAAERRRANIAGDSADGPRGHVVTVLSPKGGSGKTTIASNLAVAIAQSAPDQVCLVDLDLQFGDVSSALQLVPEHTIIDAARAGSPLDLTTLKVFLTAHPSRLYALCGTESPEEGDLVKPEAVTEILQLLSREFRYVIVDTSAGLDEHALAAIDESTDLVLVCSMDVPSVRSLRKEVGALDRLDTSQVRRLFVLNRADSRVGLNLSDIEATVGMNVDVRVPSSRSVPLSLNQGSPITESDPRSPVAREMRTLAQRFVDGPEEPVSGGGFLRRRRNR